MTPPDDSMIPNADVIAPPRPPAPTASLPFDDFDFVVDASENDEDDIDEIPSYEAVEAQDADTRGGWERDSRPEASVASLTAQMLRDLSSDEWNAMVSSAREADPEWSIDLSNQNFYEGNLSYRNFDGANFHATTLDLANMNSSSLIGANLTHASLYQTRFRYADVTDANYKDAASWSEARWQDTAGYVPPLVDCTERVARYHLNQLINDPDSIVNEGLKDLIDSGLRASWQGTELHFWMAHEIEKQRSLCSEGECGCETEHSCNGDCDCCACYSGNCDCEPDHDFESFDGTDEWYLATIVGRVTYNWNDYHGLRGQVRMDNGTMHPHVQAGCNTICWGDACQPNNLKAADYIHMVMGWIGQHNPSSEYRDVEDLPQIR